MSYSKHLLPAVILSGFSGIVYQLVWSRYMQLMFGNTVHAVATVVACYMLGLVIGSLVFGRLADRVKRSYRLFMLLEASVGVYGLCSPNLYAAVTDLNIWLAQTYGGQEMAGDIWRITLGLAYLLIPTCLMGGVFPVMVKCRNRLDESIGQDVGAIYALHTFGAAGAALITGFWLIRLIGLAGSIVIAAASNFIVVAVLFLARPGLERKRQEANIGPGESRETNGKLPGSGMKARAAAWGSSKVGRREAAVAAMPEIGGRRSRQAALRAHHFRHRTEHSHHAYHFRDRTEGLVAEAGGRSATWLLGAAFAASGFTSLSYEVLWTRSLTYFFRDTVYDFALVLAVFLLGTVLGSHVCTTLLGKIREPVRWFGIIQLLIGLASFISLLVIHRLPYMINHLQTMTVLYRDYGEYYWIAGLAIKCICTLLIVLPSTCLFGATYPLISKILVQQSAQLGRRLGWLNGLNTLGAALGSWMSGFILISWLGLHNSLLLLTLLNGCIGVEVWLLARGRIRSKGSMLSTAVIASLLLVALATATAAAPKWDKLRMSISFLEPDQDLESAVRLLYYSEDATDMVSVVEVIPYEQKFLTTNRLYTQNTSSMERTEDHRRLGHIPLLLHPEAKTVLVIGLGAGMTLSGAGAHPVESIDVVEISANVAAAANLFREENGGILDDPRIKLHIEDGRHFIQTSERRYDVIIGDIYFPMSSGSSHMYSVDYYRMVRERLRDDGLFVQWLPTHQLTLDDLKIVIRSLGEAFPRVSLWYGMIGDSAPAVGVAGTNEPLVIDFELLRQRMEMPILYEQLASVNLGDPYMLLSHFIAGDEEIAKLVRGVPVNSDNNPIIEYSAPRIYQRPYELGLDNLSTLSTVAQDAYPLLTGVQPEEAELTAQELAAHAEAKKLIIRQLKQLSDGEQTLQTITEGLLRHPDNEDLRYWYNRLAMTGL